MANEFTVSTDKEEKVQLDSGIIEASWISPIAYGGFDAKFVVKTYFVAEGSTIEIKGKSSKGKAPGKVKGQVFNNEFKGVLLIPEKVDPEAEIWFEAKLPKHGLTMESSEIPARPPIAIKELYWDRDEVTRNDTVTLTCLFESGVRDGEEAVFIIYEHNPDSCDMKVVSIPAFIEGNKAEILWEFDYIYDTKAIPTEEEKNNVQKKYVHPQYYFMVGVNGIRAGENRESGLMKFYDFLELNVADASGNAVADKTFTVSCADGSCIDGKLDDKGYAKVEKIPPGPYNVEVKDVEIGPSESAGDGGGTTADGTKDTKKNDTSTEEKNSKKDEEKKTDDVLTFPGTTFKHKKTVKTVDECLSTLPAEFRKDFKSEVENVIKEMHKLGIAMGVLSSAKAGYRSFKVQNDIDPTKTKAGPGESFHNYGIAVDLGVLEWVDEDGKKYSDFWLGTMDGIKKYKGFSSKIWKKRNELGSSKLHSLSFEIIHLQGVSASTSGKESLVKCLNKAAGDSGDAKWKYKTGSGKMYMSTLGTDATWVNIGTAKQLWNKTATNCTNAQKETIKKHMDKAEKIALTISL